MLLQRWEAKIHRKEKSPQPGIKLTTTRSWDQHAHHWATQAGLTEYWMLLLQKKSASSVQSDLILNFSTLPVNPFPNNDTFWWVWERSLLKTLWKKKKLPVQGISPLPIMFSVLSKTKIIIFVTFNLSFANAFNLVWSKFFSCGNGLTVYQQQIFRLLQIAEEKKYMTI